MYIVRFFACQKWEILIYFFHFLQFDLQFGFQFFSVGFQICFFFSAISIPHRKKTKRGPEKKMMEPKKTDDETEDSKETEVQTDKATEKKICKNNYLRASQSVALKFL